MNSILTSLKDESLNDSELSPLAKEDSNQQFAPAMSDLLDMMKSPEAKSSNERELGVNAPTGLEVSNNPELTQTTSEIPSSDSTEQEQTASTVLHLNQFLVNQKVQEPS
ncbi:hypothetical protein K05K4_50320 (plasmid) [Vibrio alginolyticus]|uniref:Uncharacterized protein n=1 Tax=Vibrio alginolyticus TaxID=663 RepID=A0A1W6UGB1_VIBAL|nr:hypothetical protein [Vibrio alginolyticus]ARP21741.1 hypothetical protein K05K4_50320 [Vibrio alginolyticus]